MYKDTEVQHEKDRIGRALSLFKDQKLLQKTLEFYLSPNVRSQDAIYMIAAVLTNPEGKAITWEFIKKNWKYLKEKYAGGHVFPRLLQYAGEFNTLKEVKDFENFFKKNPT